MSQACLPVRCHCSVNFSALRPRTPTVLASVARRVLQLNLRFRYYPGGSDARRGRSPAMRGRPGAGLRSESDFFKTLTQILSSS